MAQVITILRLRANGIVLLSLGAPLGWLASNSSTRTVADRYQEDIKIGGDQGTIANFSG